MSQLTQAWLHVNKFSGPIPDLSECSSLFDLRLRDNDFIGYCITCWRGIGLPHEIGSLELEMTLVKARTIFHMLCKEKKKLEKEVPNNKKTKIKDSGGDVNGYGAYHQVRVVMEIVISLCTINNPNIAISIEVLREVTKNFSKENILGKGGFGVVYRGQLNDGTVIAVKRMKSSTVSTKGQNEFKAEIEVLTNVRHRH
ncbi:hypothetical protein LguiA_020674 [Lonicera macranthoides]